MAVITLESLVQRGVSVLRGGQAVNTRLGTSDTADAQTPGVLVSMRHPSPGCGREFIPPVVRRGHADQARVDGAAPGAGRSRSRAGVLSRRSPARTAGGAILYGWSPSNGGPESAAAARLCLKKARPVAPAAEVPSGRQAARARAVPGHRYNPAAGYGEQCLTAGVAWCKPATRTPPASMRGKGVR
jgi:hypothetical protein